MEKNDPRTWSYEDALNNFEEFCNYFDAASATAAARIRKSEAGGATAADGNHETAIDATVLPSPELGGAPETAGGTKPTLGEDPCRVDQ